MSIENNSEFLIYQTEDGQTKIEVRMENETVLLSLNQMAELFQRDKSVISKHIKNVWFLPIRHLPVGFLATRQSTDAILLLLIRFQNIELYQKFKNHLLTWSKL